MRGLLDNRNIVGMLALTLGILLFSTQDAIIKFLSGDYAVTQALLIRSLVALPILTGMVAIESGLARLKGPYLWPMLLRGLVLLCSYTGYYLAFPAMPLAEAVSLFFVAPFLVMSMAGPLLGETIGYRSWIAVALGFVGVLIVLQPGSALFEPAALLCLMSASAYALAMILARRLGTGNSATVMSFHQNGVYIAGSALMALAFWSFGITGSSHPSLDFLVRPWTMPGPRDFLLLAACGAIAAFASSLLTHAYRMAEANLVTAIEYSGMLWTPLWGFLLFDEVPRRSTVLGAAVIVAAGLYSARLAATAPIRGPAAAT